MNHIPLFQPIILVLLLSSLATATFGDATPATLIIQLSDPTGASIPDALVVVHFERDITVRATNPEQRAGDQMTTVVVDEFTATYRINLAPGTYNIFAACRIFNPSSTKVRLEKGETHKINMRLRYDPFERRPQAPPSP